jgi:hypothetical protein
MMLMVVFGSKQYSLFSTIKATADLRTNINRSYYHYITALFKAIALLLTRAKA